MTTVDFEKRVAFHFLDSIKESFLSKFGHMIETAVAYEMNSYAAILQEKMDYFTANPNASDKLGRIKGEVDEVRHLMVDNIERILDRGDKIELLVDKAEDLSEQATKFKKSGSQLQKKMWWGQFKLQAMICAAVTAVLSIIILASTKCFGKC